MTLEIVPATMADTDELHALTLRVWQQMTHREWFAPETDAAYLSRLLDTRKGEIWKAVDTEQGRVAGYFAVVFPGADQENLGYDIGLKGEELLRVAHMDTVVVHPDYRGQGLQRRMASHIEPLLREKGYRHLLCTVHPDNVYSLGNMERCGYRKAVRTLKYGGLPRYILQKEMSSEGESHP